MTRTIKLSLSVQQARELLNLLTQVRWYDVAPDDPAQEREAIRTIREKLRLKLEAREVQE